jgi:hypothetical protein
MIVLLDAGPLGMISNPKASVANRECYRWMESLVSKGTPFRKATSRETAVLIGHL